MHVNATDATRYALKIAASYLAFALLWIKGSDYVLSMLTQDHDAYIRYQTYKGAVFVASTALLVLMLVRRQMSALVEARNAARCAAADVLVSEARFRGIYERSLAAILIVGGDDRVEGGNPAARKMLGYDEGELNGRSVQELIHPDDLPAELESRDRLRSGALDAFEVENRYLHKSGNPIWVHKVVSSLPATEGNKLHIFALAIDVTENHRANDALRQSEQRLSYVMMATKEGIWDWAIPADTVSHNRRWCELFGLDESFLQHRLSAYTALIHDDDRHRVQDAINDCLAGHAIYHSVHRMRHSDGNFVWVEDRGDVVERDAAGRALRMVGSTADITARCIAQQEADRQRAMLQSVFESSPDCLIVTDSKHRVVTINPACRDVFGYTIDELRGRSTRLLYISDQEWTDVGELLEAGQVALRATHGVRKNGEIFPCQVTGARMRDSVGQVLGYVGSIRDISLERKRELALREKQRLEALGRLTSGIAHDFNNLLTVISGYLQLLDIDLADEKLKKPLKSAMQATEIGARINRRLLTFARQRNLDPVFVDLNALITSMLDLVRAVLGEQIALETRWSGAEPTVSVDVGELESAILNLALNSRDAMPTGGKFLIETSIVEIGSSDAGLPAELSPGEYARITVSDTGIGMSDEVLSRAFEPFFTTKEPGKGSGLGLTSLHGFVRQSSGRITISSEPGRGTTVSIDLPRHTGDAEVAATPAPGVSSIPYGHGEAVLLVEDSAEVRRITAERLSRLGYKVMEAASGVAAREIIENGADFDLVFTDMVMPGGVSGFDVLRHATYHRPHAALLLTTGFSDGVAQLEAENFQNVAILRKPYSFDDLARAVAASLHRAKTRL